MERLLEVGEAAATFLNGNELEPSTDPDLVSPAVERKADLERPLHRHVLGGDTHRFGGELVIERAHPLRQPIQIHLHG
jgi:hypothetical protein